MSAPTRNEIYRMAYSEFYDLPAWKVIYDCGSMHDWIDTWVSGYEKATLTKNPNDWFFEMFEG